MKYLLPILLILIIISCVGAQTKIPISSLPDGGATVDGNSVLLGNIGSRTGPTSRFTVNQLFNIKLGTMTNNRYCYYNPATAKIDCTQSGTGAGTTTFEDTVHVKGPDAVTSGKICLYPMDDAVNPVCINAPNSATDPINIYLVSSLPDETKPLGLSSAGSLAPMTEISGLSVYGGTNFALAYWDSNTPANLDSLDTGTAGQTLTSGGTGAPPLWSSSLNLTGNLTGLVKVVPATTSCTIGSDCDSASVAVARGGAIFATAAITVTLPEIVATPSATQVAVGASLCVITRDNNEQLVVDPHANDSITLAGAKGSPGASVQNTVGESSGGGDYICFLAVENDNWMVMGSKGTWGVTP